ncbi:hypothetical protein TRVL_09713 [Trypanosoma vivax]|nr:hypothetical protein TRVL_09713 [Trypanosoma vivax]
MHTGARLRPRRKRSRLADKLHMKPSWMQIKQAEPSDSNARVPSEAEVRRHRRQNKLGLQYNTPHKCVTTAAAADVTIHCVLHSCADIRRRMLNDSDSALKGGTGFCHVSGKGSEAIKTLTPS